MLYDGRKGSFMSVTAVILTAVVVFTAAYFLISPDSTGECIAAVLIPITVALLLAWILFHKRRNHVIDNDPDGTDFVRQLTEMTDTISRATAERECGIYTQMLYEQARFCEPSADVRSRLVERKILQEICAMRPTDSDQVMAEKCAAVMKLLEKRDNV